MAAPGFPQYSDGDVEIHLSTNEKLVLHSLVLSMHAKWFEASLHERWARSVPTSQGGASSVIGEDSIFGAAGLQESKQVHVYELRFEKDTADGQLYRRGVDIGKLFDEGTEEGQTSTQESITETEVAEKMVREERRMIIKAHKLMLGTLYHCVPTLSFESFAQGKRDVEVLLKMAVMYGCELVVRPHVNNHMAAYRDAALYKCASDPIAMLEFSLKFDSAWIFREAATNLLGRSKTFYDATEPKLKELGVAELMAGKRKRFISTLSGIDLALFMMQPTDASSGAQQELIAFFCYWLRTSFCASQGSCLAPGYAKVYHAIADVKYFSTKDREAALKAYLKLIGYSDEDAGKYRSDIPALFKRAAEIVKSIVRDETRLQSRKTDPYRALTFMTIQSDELPWAKKDG